MKNRFCRAAVLAVALVLPCREAQASCGAANCPMDMGGHDALAAGNLRLDLSFQYLDQDVPRAGRHRAAVGEDPNAEHDEVATINRTLTLRADYDLSSRWGLGLQLPFVARTHDHIEVESGESEHWGYAGAGDLVAQVCFAALQGEGPASPLLLLTAAGKFPTGRTQARNEGDERAETTIQPGSGSYDFIGGAAYSQKAGLVPNLQGGFASLPVFASVFYRLNNAGSEGYRLGNELQANAGTAYPLLRKLEVLGQANFRVKGKDAQGRTLEDVSFTGGTFVYLSPGLRWHWTRALSTYAVAQLPVYQRVNREQLTYDRGFLLGATYQFGGAGLSAASTGGAP